MQKQIKIILIFVIISLAVFLRFWYLAGSGYRFSDEGFYFFPSFFMEANPDFSFICYKPGLCFWVWIGLKIFGFTFNGSLYWSVFCGLLTIPVFYFICTRLMNTLTSLIGALIFSVSYYILYYHRCNMSDGYALFFFCLTMLFILISFQAYHIFPSTSEISQFVSKKKYLFIIAGGICWGFTFTLRTHTYLTLVGVIGAIGVSLMTISFKHPWSNEIKNIWKRYILISASLFAISVIFYACFMLYLGSWVRWSSLIDEYILHVVFPLKGITKRSGWGSGIGGGHDWHPFVFMHLWNLCSMPFLIVGFLGVITETVNFKKLDLTRRWFLICFWGLLFISLKMSFPFPKIYLYVVFFLIIYFVLAITWIYELSISKNIRILILVLIIVVTVLNEFFLCLPFIKSKSHYTEAVKFVKMNGLGHIIGSYNWPIFRALKGDLKGFTVDATIEKNPTYKEFCSALKYGYEKKDVRYMILDHNLTHLGGDLKLLQQFVVTNLPEIVLPNDFGEDYHTCWDAFGKPPRHDMFSDKIIVYDLKNFKHAYWPPFPYTNDENMDQLFLRRLKERRISDESD